MAIRWKWAPRIHKDEKAATRSPYAKAVDKALFELPDLQPYPGPLDKAHVLLESAAEIEHMLLVQYLYAAFTLKSDQLFSELKAEEQKAVRAWRRTLMTVAIEEMGHLMSIQNLRLLVGADPVFDREEFPPKVEGVYPFIPHLEPLSTTSLAKYILAESSFSDEAKLETYRDIVGQKTPVRHVGVVYGLLAVLFSSHDTLPSTDSPDHWEQFVCQVASSAGALISPEYWHLPEGVLHPESFERQADPAHFSSSREGFFFDRIRTSADARKLVRNIGLQGEAPVEGTAPEPVSHYQQFRRMFEGSETILKFPVDGSFVPSFDVETDPKLENYDGLALEKAKVCDKVYAEMVQSLTNYLSATIKTDRERFANDALGQMGDLKSLAQDLLQLPQKTGGIRRASPLFSVPKGMNS